MTEEHVPFPINYRLLDAGSGFRVEQWGDIVTIRPETQAYFTSGFPLNHWEKIAHWRFIPEKDQSVIGKWLKLREDAPQVWIFDMESVQLEIQIATNKHLGIFPEQQNNWDFLTNELSKNQKYLNLFAYTGAASLFAALTGAEVTHVESMKGTIQWAKENAQLNGLSTIRWFQDDAYKLIERELKRGNNYDIIQLDPPAFGTGAKGERWKIEDKLPQLLENCISLLAPKGKIILSTYSPKMPAEKIASIIKQLPEKVQVETKEPYLLSETNKKLKLGLQTYIWK